jgi:hypothetical protein
MRERIIEALKRIGRWFRYWFYRRPVSKPEPLTAKEVVDHWTILDYHGQKINLHKHEVPMFNALSRKDKRAMALRFQVMEKKGEIKFMEIEGKMTCVYNRDYDKRAEKKKALEHGL